MRNKKRLLIIPDVHGRKFWRKAAENNYALVDKVIFLGDYMDPYEQFDYDPLGEFRDIIELKKKHPRKVVLLLGNHDTHYLYEDFIKGSRFDWMLAPRIAKILEENVRLFRFAHSETLGNGRVVLFTHAGIANGWLRQNELKIPKDPTKVAEWLEHWVPLRMFDQVGRSRGGYAPVGSPLWADIDDHFPYREIIPGLCQVVGHSYSPWHILGGTPFACLDCGRAFIMTDGGIFGMVE